MQRTLILEWKRSQRTICKRGSEQLKQAFFNIIGNAIDAVPEHSEIRIITGIDSDHVLLKSLIKALAFEKKISLMYLNLILPPKRKAMEWNDDCA